MPIGVGEGNYVTDALINSKCIQIFYKLIQSFKRHLKRVAEEQNWHSFQYNTNVIIFKLH